MSKASEYGIVKHFKHEKYPADDPHYIYQMIGISEHTETGEITVAYRALYKDEEKGIYYGFYNRPIEMFTSEVDREKYPDVKQVNRFELITEEEFAMLEKKIMPYVMVSEKHGDCSVQALTDDEAEKVVGGATGTFGKCPNCGHTYTSLMDSTNHMLSCKYKPKV